MMADQITLYASPGSCSRVTMTALEEAGLDYSITIIRLQRQENLSRDFLEKNSSGKVPTIHVDGVSLTENVAIISWLNETQPSAGLLPPTSDPLVKAQQLSHLCFCSATLHPIVSRIAMSANFASIDAAPDVRSRAEALMRRFMKVVDERLTERYYWYGERWSMMDSYLAWVYARVVGVGFDASTFRHLGAMVEREALRPATVRVAAAENDMFVRLAGESSVSCS